jgi:hypothetical protein
MGVTVSDLTPEEQAQAEQLLVYTIWYEDQFGDGDAFPMAICLSEAEARAEYDRLIRDGICKPLEPGWDGIVMDGPMPLSPRGRVGCSPATVRDILRRAGQGIRGPIHVANQ